MQAAQSLFEAGRAAHEQGEVEAAYEQYAQAHRIARELGVRIVGLEDSFAELCVSVQEFKQAKELYREVIRTDSQEIPQRYLALAQLETGSTAAGLYLKGIELLRAVQSAQQGEEEFHTGASAIASAYAALAELYMTDLW